MNDLHEYCNKHSKVPTELVNTPLMTYYKKNKF